MLKIYYDVFSFQEFINNAIKSKLIYFIFRELGQLKIVISSIIRRK